jgi:hypothetical protein
LIFNDTRGVLPDQGVHPEDLRLRRATVNAVGDVSFGTRLRGRLAAAWRFVRTAPLTYLWLAVLLGTTIRQLQAGRHLHRLLVHASTNIHDLATDPLHVLSKACCGSTADPGRRICCCSLCS